MTQEEADEKNAEIQKIYEQLKKEYTLEEIADSFIFPHYRSDEEEKELTEQLKKFIKEYREKNPLSNEQKKHIKELQERFKREDNEES